MKNTVKNRVILSSEEYHGLNLKQIATFIVLFLIISGFLTAIIIYAARSDRIIAEENAHAGKALSNPESDFLNDLYEFAPEYAPERVSYNAYEITAGTHLKATLTTSAVDDDLLISLQFDFGEDYFKLIPKDGKDVFPELNNYSDELVKDKYNEIASAADTMLRLGYSYYMNDFEKEKFIDTICVTVEEKTTELYSLGSRITVSSAMNDNNSLCIDFIPEM